MKYIIEFEDEPYMREGEEKYYTCKSARWFKLEETIINKLTPFTEPNREAIEDEVWKFAKKIGSFNGLAKHELDECFGHTTIQGVMTTYDTYREAKREYEKWKKSKEKIRVGDEVIIKSDGVKGVVLDEDLCGEFFVFTENECCETYRKIHFEKTGRHFPEVAELLKKMREK